LLTNTRLSGEHIYWSKFDGAIGVSYYRSAMRYLSVYMARVCLSSGGPSINTVIQLMYLVRTKAHDYEFVSTM